MSQLLAPSFNSGYNLRVMTTTSASTLSARLRVNSLFPPPRARIPVFSPSLSNKKKYILKEKFYHFIWEFLFSSFCFSKIYIKDFLKFI